MSPFSLVPLRALLFVALAGACACGGSPTRPTVTSPPVTGAGTTSPGTSTNPPQPTTPPPRELSITRVLCFGDSLTEGVVSTSTSGTLRLHAVGPDAYPAVLSGLLSASYSSQRFTVTNAGKSGEWAADGQLRLRSVIRSAPYDVVVILQGSNDLLSLGSKGVRPTLDALENMLREVRSAGQRGLLCSLPPQRSGSKTGTASALIPEFNAGVRQIAEGQRQYFVDVHAAFANDLTLIGSDGLHPTAAGYARIAQAVFDTLRANFERTPSTTSADAGPS